MNSLLYQIEIIVLGGPRGYSYEDSYKTSIKKNIHDLIAECNTIDSKIEREKFERSRYYILYTFNHKNSVVSEIKFNDINNLI